MYQASSKKQRNSGNKSLLYSNISSEQQFSNRRYQQDRFKWNRSKTEGVGDGPDSLQTFQQELNSILISNRKKKLTKKKNFFPTIQAERPQQQISEINQIKNQMQQIKNMLENKQRRTVQEKLQKIIIELENQKQRRKILSSRNQFQSSHKKTQSQYHPPTPFYLPQPQIIYPPQPYYPPPSYPQSYQQTRRRKKRQSPQSEQDSQDDDYETAKKNMKQLFRSRKAAKTPKIKSKKPIKNRLKILFLAAFYFVCLKAEARKNAATRRSNLQVFCKEKFYSQINNVKEWLLQSQKLPFSIILQKKNLNFQYMNETSSKVKEQKINLVIHIVSLGLKNLEGIATPQKIKPFKQLLSKLCLNKSYPINSLWTSEQMKLVCVSQEFGFFKIDESLQKFLICLLVFVKIFIFNMLLQPFKFDKVNFQKKAQPMASNMKLISSIYYLLTKQVLSDYISQKRSKTFYKIGNHQSARMAKPKFSQALVYQKAKPTPSEYISGLYGEQISKQLKQFDFWDLCIKNIKQIIDKIHSQVKAKKY